jgi:hypothetical protein
MQVRPLPPRLTTRRRRKEVNWIQEFQSRGRVLRLMENQIGIVPMSIQDYERLKKHYEGQETVETDMYGDIIKPYTLH